MERIGIIGLGNMGSGMAKALKDAGFTVLGTARSAQTRNRAHVNQIETVETVAELASAVDVIVLALPKPETVIDVVESRNGIKTSGRRGQLIIDTTTSDALTSRAVEASLQERGMTFIDAPMSGAPALARKGQLTSMVGGSSENVAFASPVLKALCANIVHVGPVGTGNIAKLANNLMASAHFMVAAEALMMATRAGIEPEDFMQVINASTGRSFITERVYPNWVFNGKFDLGFSVELMRKDVRLALEEIERLGLDLPVAELVAQEWLTSGTLVANDEDITRIVELPQRKAARASGIESSIHP